MPTINAFQFNPEAYVEVDVDWSDYPQVTHARVVRRNTVTGELFTLRPHGAYDAGGNLLLSCGSGVWWDTEPPLNVELEYCTYPADPQTLLTSNPDFEVTDLPWQDIGSTLARSNTFAHAGTWSGRITPSGGDGGAILNTDLQPNLTVGEPITVQAWALTPQGWNAVYLTAYVEYDDGDSDSFRGPVYVLDDNTWQFLQFSFTITKPGHLIGIEFRYLGPAPGTTLFYVDEIGAYQAQPLADVYVCADPLTILPSESVWLKNPLDPCLDVEIGFCVPEMDFDCEEDSRISYVGMADDELDANTVLSMPANRKNPIPVNRIRRSPRSELRLLAHDCAARDRVLAINDPGNPLLFQAPADYCIPDRYISVGMLTESRFSVDQRDDFRLMLLPYAVVDRPTGPANGICGVRFMDLCDIYTSWASMMEFGGFTYMMLVLGYASYESPLFDLESMRTWGEVRTEFADWLAVEAGGTRDWGELRDGL